MNNNSKDQNKSSMVPFALVAAIVGGIGAAVLANPKHKKITENLTGAGDEIVDKIDEFLSKFEGKKNLEDSPLSETSEMLLGLVNELKLMNSAAEEPIKKPSFVQRMEDRVSTEIHDVEHFVTDSTDDISKHIAWLQKKGKSLARKRIID